MNREFIFFADLKAVRSVLKSHSTKLQVGPRLLTYVMNHWISEICRS